MATDCGLTVLMLPNANPSKPSPGVWTNWVDNVLASSTAWSLMTIPPRLTLSVPTSPDALDPSPYEIFQVLPDFFLKVDDLDESKIVWDEPPCFCVLADSSVDQTYYTNS